jgi:hypothetical protein
MAKIRSELHQDMRGVVGGAAAVADWRTYVRERPWLAVGVAFAAGYMLVPRRIASGPTFVMPMHSEPTGVEAARHEQRPARFKPFRWALGIVGPVAIRAAQSYAGNAIENLLINQQSSSGPAPENAAQVDERSAQPGFWPGG